MKKICIALLALTLLLSMFTGCARQDEGAALTETGTLILRVNPEISVQYNKKGLVTKIEGLNDDGTAIVRAYDDYIGKECRAVVQDLVGEINAAGYLVADVDGNHRNITIQIEPGSVLPEADFLQTIASDVQTTIASLNLDSKVLEIGTSDYDARYATDNAPSDYITIDAKTGAVLKSRNNTAGASDYGDTDYGVTDYGATDYGTSDYGATDYGTSDYGNSGYDSSSDYGNSSYDSSSGYGNSGYDSSSDYGNSSYDNSSDYGNSGYDQDSGYGDSGYDD